MIKNGCNKFEIAYDYIHKCGKQLCTGTHWDEWFALKTKMSKEAFIDPPIIGLIPPVIADTYALPCQGRLFVVREGCELKVQQDENEKNPNVTCIKTLRVIYDALTKRTWSSSEEPSAEFIILYEWILMQTCPIRLIKN